MLDLNPQEVRALFEASSNDGKTLSYLKWINDMRGQMPSSREKLCSELFQMLDSRGDKLIKIGDFERRYNPEASKDVRDGRKSGDELYDEM